MSWMAIPVLDWSASRMVRGLCVLDWTGQQIEW